MASQFRSRRILIVDDLSVNLVIGRAMLKQIGYEVEVACDADEAVACCLACAPDGVLMDIEMPGVDGIETTQRLRSLQRDGTLASFPIIALSAYSAAEVEWQAAGMTGYLQKPIGKERL